MTEVHESQKTILRRRQKHHRDIERNRTGPQNGKTVPGKRGLE